MKITVEQRLAMYSKASRENSHVIKPICTTDKKKKENKLACRKKNWV